MGNGESSTIRNFIVCIVHSNIVNVVKSRISMWADHLARIGISRGA
jgi:hypothetical protein